MEKQKKMSRTNLLWLLCVALLSCNSSSRVKFDELEQKSCKYWYNGALFNGIAETFYGNGRVSDVIEFDSGLAYHQVTYGYKGETIAKTKFYTVQKLKNAIVRRIESKEGSFIYNNVLVLSPNSLVDSSIDSINHLISKVYMPDLELSGPYRIHYSNSDLGHRYNEFLVAKNGEVIRD